MLKLKILKVDSSAVIPTFATPGSACFDIAALETTHFYPGMTIKLRTGLAFEVPIGFFLDVRPRSSMSLRGLHIINTPATLDADYRGELLIVLFFNPPYNHNKPSPETIHKGDRIAQARVVPLEPTAIVEVHELSPTSRGDRGFGSTGR